MPSNTDYIMQGFQGLSAVPGAINAGKQYDATYGQASPEENELFEMRKKFVMQGGDGNIFDAIVKGKDPNQAADEAWAGKRPPGGQPPQAPMQQQQQPMPMQGSPQPQGVPMMSAQNAPPQPFYGGGGLGAPAQTAPPPPSNEPVPYEPSGMVDLARGNRMGGGMSDMRPPSQPASEREPRTRDSMARMNSMMNDMETSRVRQSMAFRNTQPRAGPLTFAERLALQDDKQAGDLDRDRAKAEDASEQLIRTLDSKKDLAALARALAEQRLGFDQQQWEEKLDYWNRLMEKRDGWEKIKQLGSADKRALDYFLGVVSAFGKVTAAPPFQKENIQSIKDLIPPNAPAIRDAAGKTLEGQLGGPPSAPPSFERESGSTMENGPQPVAPIPAPPAAPTPAPKKKLSPVQQQTADWIKKNPKDPRVPALRAKFGL